MQADFVVKTVMILLMMASVWSWAIIFEKVMLLRSAREDAKKFEAQFWSGGSLDEMFDRLEAKPFRLDPMSAIFVAAMREWRRSSGVLNGGIHGTSLQQRIDRVMQITLDDVFGIDGFRFAVYRLVRNGMGDYEQLSFDRRQQQYVFGSRCPRYRRSAVCDGIGVGCGHSRGVGV